MNPPELALAASLSGLVAALTARAILLRRVRPSVVEPASVDGVAVRWIADAHREVAEEEKLLAVMRGNPQAASPAAPAPAAPVAASAPAPAPAPAAPRPPPRVMGLTPDGLERRLRADLVGQPGAAAQLVQLIRERQAFLAETNTSPLAFLLIGDDSTGRRHCCRLLAEEAGVPLEVLKCSAAAPEELAAAFKAAAPEGQAKVLVLEDLDRSLAAFEHLNHLLAFPTRDWARTIIIGLVAREVDRQHGDPETGEAWTIQDHDYLQARIGAPLHGLPVIPFRTWDAQGRARLVVELLQLHAAEQMIELVGISRHAVDHILSGVTEHRSYAVAVKRYLRDHVDRRFVALRKAAGPRPLRATVSLTTTIDATTSITIQEA